MYLKCLLVILLVLSLWACGADTPTETTLVTTVSTTAPTTEHTTETPTESAEITHFDSVEYCHVPEEYAFFIFDAEDTRFLPETDISKCVDKKMYVYDESQDNLWLVAEEDVMASGGIINTKDHIYYIPENDHTKLYRVEYSGENKTLLYESEHDEISWMDYFGVDPDGVMYLLTGGNRIIALNIATGNVETVMEQYEIISFIYYPDYVRDGGEHLGPTFDWIGKPNEDDKNASYLYCIETGENIYFPRL